MSNLGAYVVAIFFCVNGFLIVQTLVGRQIMAMFTAGPWFGYEWMGQLLGHPGACLASSFSKLFFLPGLFNLPITQKNAWSLSFEALFYILAALSYWSRPWIRTWLVRSVPAAVKGQGMLGRFLSRNPMRLLRKISYSLYLMHPFAMEPVRVLLLKSGRRAHPFAAGVCFLAPGPALAIGLSYLSFVFIEKKLTRALRECASRWNSVKTAAVKSQLGDWQAIDSGRLS